jgi:hypothetical protein
MEVGNRVRLGTDPDRSLPPHGSIRSRHPHGSRAIRREQRHASWGILRPPPGLLESPQDLGSSYVTWHVGLQRGIWVSRPPSFMALPIPFLDLSRWAKPRGEPPPSDQARLLDAPGRSRGRPRPWPGRRVRPAPALPQGSGVSSTVPPTLTAKSATAVAAPQ